MPMWHQRKAAIDLANNFNQVYSNTIDIMESFMGLTPPSRRCHSNVDLVAYGGTPASVPRVGQDDTADGSHVRQTIASSDVGVHDGGQSRPLGAARVASFEMPPDEDLKPVAQLGVAVVLSLPIPAMSETSTTESDSSSDAANDDDSDIDSDSDSSDEGVQALEKAVLEADEEWWREGLATRITPGYPSRQSRSGLFIRRRASALMERAFSTSSRR